MATYAGATSFTIGGGHHFNGYVYNLDTGSSTPTEKHFIPTHGGTTYSTRFIKLKYVGSNNVCDVVAHTSSADPNTCLNLTSNPGGTAATTCTYVSGDTIQINEQNGSIIGTFVVSSTMVWTGPTVTDLEWVNHTNGGLVWHGTFLTSGTFVNTDLTISNEAGTLSSSDVFVQAAQFPDGGGGFDPGYRFRIVPNGTTTYMCELGTLFAWGYVEDPSQNQTSHSTASITIPTSTSITASTDDGSGIITQLTLTQQQRHAQNVVWTAPSGHLFGPLQFWLTTSLSDSVNHTAYPVGTPIAELRVYEENSTGASRLGLRSVFILGAQTTMTQTWLPYSPSLESVITECVDWNPLNSNNNNSNPRRRAHSFW